jgi:plastocyanin
MLTRDEENKMMIEKLMSITVMITVAFILVLGGTHLALSTSATSNARVAAGGNGSSWDSYSPQSIKINRGDTVSWYNPSAVAEPHTVTFVFNGKTMTSVETPFAVSNSTKFIALPRGSNSQPNMIPGTNGMNTVIVSNGRSLIAQLVQHFHAQGMDVNQEAFSAVENLNLKGNKRAIELLESGFGDAKVRYLKAGDVLDQEKISIRGLSVHILGPPEDEEFLAQMKPPSSQRYLRLVGGQTEVVNAIQPFEQRWRVDKKDLDGVHLDEEDEKKMKNLANLSLDDLAFALDQARNNESLVTLFNLGNQYLLFPGDAQYGNWRWWLENDKFRIFYQRLHFSKLHTMAVTMRHPNRHSKA